MRRFTAASVLLLLLTLWSAPLLSVLTARSAEDNLPACCRRNGKHHCMMMMQMSMRDTGSGPAFTVPFQACPLFPRSLVPNIPAQHLFTAPASGIFYTQILSHPAVAPQTEAHYRVSFDRARHKRGPPALL